uniref:Uncharacterized protein n=1 Tax=Oryza nivara TaxID=4536 RepID=A0A0E0HZC3_ORYNI
MWGPCGFHADSAATSDKTGLKTTEGSRVTVREVVGGRSGNGRARCVQRAESRQRQASVAAVHGWRAEQFGREGEVAGDPVRARLTYLAPDVTRCAGDDDKERGRERYRRPTTVEAGELGDGLLTLVDQAPRSVLTHRYSACRAHGGG